MLKKEWILLWLFPLSGWTIPFDFNKTWTGIYAGGNLGGIFNQAVLNANHEAFSNWEGVCHHNNDFSSFFMGPQAGALLQLSSHWVVGVEGDFTYNFSQSSSYQCDCDFYAEVYDKFTVYNRNQGSLRGRLGYVLDHHLLPYFSGGASFANIGINYTNEVANDYSSQKIQTGWVFGGGMEWAYSPQISMRLEYYYNEYPRLGMPISTIYGVEDGAGQAAFNLSANNIRAVFSYWF